MGKLVAAGIAGLLLAAAMADAAPEKAQATAEERRQAVLAQCNSILDQLRAETRRIKIINTAFSLQTSMGKLKSNALDEVTGSIERLGRTDAQITAVHAGIDLLMAKMKETDRADLPTLLPTFEDFVQHLSDEWEAIADQRAQTLDIIDRNLGIDTESTVKLADSIETDVTPPSQRVYPYTRLRSRP